MFIHFSDRCLFAGSYLAFMVWQSALISVSQHQNTLYWYKTQIKTMSVQWNIIGCIVFSSLCSFASLVVSTLPVIQGFSVSVCLSVCLSQILATHSLIGHCVCKCVCVCGRERQGVRWVIITACRPVWLITYRQPFSFCRTCNTH